MKPAEVMAEVAQVAGGLKDVRKHWGYPPDDIPVVPSVYVSYPQQGTFDETYQRGVDGMTDLAIVMVAGEPGRKETHDLMMGWAAGSGPTSLVERLHGWAWQSCDSVDLTTWEVIPETVAGVAHLAVMFRATVQGPGGTE